MGCSFSEYGKHLPGQLLVEGSNDFHVLCSLFQKRAISKDAFGIKEKGSYEELRDGLDVELDVEHVETIGIVVDADDNLEARWRELQALLASLGFVGIPEQPSQQGCILSGRKRLGIWLMPNNQVTGILEDFVAYLVPDRDADPLWLHTKNAINGIPEGHRKFPDGRLAKAHLYTWLAWQKDPGMPMGRAIMARYLDANSPSADTFIAWIKNLFQLS